MLALMFGVLLGVSPPVSADSLDGCLAQAPAESPPPVTWGQNVQQMWGEDPPVPFDSLRTYLDQVRSARSCLRSLDSSHVERPYRGNIMRTYFVETAILAGLRRFSESIDTFEQARSYLASNPSVPSAPGGIDWMPELHRNQGFLYYILGNLSGAIEQYLGAYRTAPEEKPRMRIQFLIDVGILHQRTQDYASARHYYQRADDLFRKSRLQPEANTSLRVRLLSVRGDLLLERTLTTEFAPDPLRRARELHRRALGLATPGTERYARTAISLSENLGYLGAFEEAYRLNEEVWRYADANDDPRLKAFALLKRGVLHVQTERWARADSILRRARVLAEDVGDLDYQRRVLRTLGRLHEIQEHWTRAERLYRQGIRVVEAYRESLTASQWSMTAFAQWREVHRGLVRVLLAQDRPQEAFRALDRSRARHLQDLRTQSRVSNQLPSIERARLDSLTRALSDVRNRVGTGDLSPDERARLRNEEARLMAARQQLLSLDSSSPQVSLAVLSETLAQKNRVLVSYYLDDPWPVFDRPPRSVAFVLTPDSLRTVSLDGLTQDDVQEHVESVSPLFSSSGKPHGANEMHFDLRPLHRLYDAVYAPIAKHLPDRRPLTVIPDGPLFHLPFSMLVRSMPKGRFAPSAARFVLHDRATSHELAASLVLDTARTRDRGLGREPRMVAYGVSNFDTLRTVPSALRTVLPEAVSDSMLALPPLPGVRQELRALQSTVDDARVVLNGQATEANFQHSVRTAGVLHVASHAFVNPSSPLRNALLLHPDSSSNNPSDGILFLHELQDQQAQLPMVVLSGCNTASGTLRGGEGMEGLQYAFRAMGAESTVSTLWPVSDKASVELMDAFYRHLREGHAKDVALRRAQLSFLNAHPDKASPFFWAPPVLYGSPSTLPLDGPLVPGWVWWGLFATALLVLGGGAGYLARTSRL